MIGKLLRYGIIGLVAFAIGLVTFLPARVAAGWVEAAAPVDLGGVTGTLFEGRAAYAAGPGAAVENLRWRLKPGELLLGRLAADIQIDSDLSGFSASAAYSLFGGASVDAASGSATVGWLAKLAGYTFLPLSADLRVNVEQAQLDDAFQLRAIAGRLSMANARWDLLNPPVELGSFVADVMNREDGIALSLADGEGPLALDGSVALSEAGVYRLDVRLRPRAGADERLGRLLSQIGRPDAQGWITVREQGRL